MRRFLLVAHRAATSADLPLNDLPGKGGRMDLVARCMTSALLHSHGIRQDTEFLALLLGPPHAPKAIRVRGAAVRHLHPDERAAAALIQKALAVPTTGPVWREAIPGVDIATLELPELRAHVGAGAVVLLDEKGEDLERIELPADDVTFLLGDDQDLRPEERVEVLSWSPRPVSLGPVSLQADQCIVIAQNRLDRARM